MTTTLAAYFDEIEERALKEALKMFDKILERVDGVRHGKHELQGDDFVAWFEMMANRKGVQIPEPQVDPMTGQPVLDEMGQPVMVPGQNWVDQVTGQPIPPNEHKDGAVWVASLSQKNGIGGRALLDQYNRNKVRQFQGEIEAAEALNVGNVYSY